jgi:hypothetical protein
VKRNIAGVGVTSFIQDDRKYAIFLRGRAVVKYVKGEFYWRVQKGDTVAVADYVAPPYMISIEKDDQEITVAQGEYLEPEEVAKAFGVWVPDKSGVAPNQPPPFYGKLGRMVRTGVMAVLLATAVQTAGSIMSDDETVYNMQQIVMPADKDKTLTSPVFALSRDGNVLIQTSSRLDNNWAEYNVVLVAESGQTYRILQGVEFYHGYDSDGSWSEGSSRGKTYISAVPAGLYKLLIDADSDLFSKNQALEFTLNVRRDVPSISNYWIIVLLLMCYPVFAMLRRSSFENTRWSESDFERGSNF